MSAYVPLWVKSNHSLHRAASHPHELIAQAAHHGLPALGLCDHLSLSGIVQAHLQAEQYQLRLLIGCELPMTDGSHTLLYPTDAASHAALSRLLSAPNTQSQGRLTYPDLFTLHPNLLFITDAFSHSPAETLQALVAHTQGRLYALISRHQRPLDTFHNRRAQHTARQHGVPLVAAQETLYHAPERRPLHDILTAIRHQRPLSELGALLPPNATHSLLSAEAFQRLFHDLPEAIHHGHEILSRIHWSLDALPLHPPAPNLGAEDPSTELHRLAFEGAKSRYGHPLPAPVTRQLEHELQLVHSLDYGIYFLIMHEIVSFCRQHAILCQGRGSAANSLLCYCLGITAIDPLAMGLLFERFLSKERAEPPDIDLDIMHSRREEVIAFLYQRHGLEHTAMLSSTVRYRHASALRAVHKALGLPLQLAADPAHHLTQLSHSLARDLTGFPQHLSVHPGGFVLTQQPTADLAPIRRSATHNRRVVHWDKYDAEALGLFKIDLLALGALSHLDGAFRLLKAHLGLQLDMATLPHHDPKTFALCAAADTLGVFQIESRAQMNMLPRLRPQTFYDLVIQIALVRPGPISGEMVHPYLQRRQGRQPITYAHPELEPILAKTLGVPLFQEQVMKIAIAVADYSPGEADQLRRDMGSWRQTEAMEKHRQHLITRMQARGISRRFAERISKQIEAFGEYGFPESHAASFALIAYASAWLKANHPAFFFAALFNAMPMGFYPLSTLIADAQRHGIQIEPIDARHSQWHCTLLPLNDIDGSAHNAPSASAPPRAFAIRMGLCFIQGLSREAAQSLIQRRRPATDLPSFLHPLQLSPALARRLATSGALDAFATQGRRQLLWEVEAHRPDSLLLEEREPAVQLPPLPSLEQILWDLESTHHSLHAHPLSPFRAALSQQGFLTSERLLSQGPKAHVRFAGLVICRQRPPSAKGMIFMTLEDEAGLLNLIVRPPIAARYPQAVNHWTFIAVEGPLESRDGVTHLIARRFWLPQASSPPDGGDRIRPSDRKGEKTQTQLALPGIRDFH